MKPNPLSQWKSCDHRSQVAQSHVWKGKLKRVRGFSLLEVLVAILIVAILLVISVPLAGKAVYQARIDKSIP